MCSTKEKPLTFYQFRKSQDAPSFHLIKGISMFKKIFLNILNIKPKADQSYCPGGSLKRIGNKCSRSRNTYNHPFIPK